MKKLIVIIGAVLVLSGCESMGLRQTADAPAPANESELMDSQQVVVPAAGDDSQDQAAQDSPDTPDGSELDSSIDPTLKPEVQHARENADKTGTDSGSNSPDETADNTDTGGMTDAHHDLWDHLRSTFALNLSQDNPRIEAQIKWYVAHQAYLDRCFQRGSRYLYYITEQLQKNNMPGELALLPIVESAFDPFAYSHGRASGLWQFIPSTGRIYGLHQDWWYDGRRDIVSSTKAAVNYFQALSNRFNGQWLLALASYNSGAGTVLRAVNHNQARHRPTDFWHLHLPRETSAYVPKLLAIAKIVANPQKYGVTLQSIPDQPYFSIVDVGSQIDLAQAAKLAGADLDQIYLLNPGFNRWATDPKGPHRLLVPAKNADSFQAALAQLSPRQRLKWDHYRVRSGDTLLRIAHHFRTTPEFIRKVNRLASNMIRQGQELLIPVASHDGSYYSLSASQRRRAVQASYSGEGLTRVNYRVRAGDTLWDIARAHNVSVRKLAKWNSMAPTDPLMPGKSLVIWSHRTHMTLASNRMRHEMVRKIGYHVHHGDSLYRIADRFNVSVNDIVGWNEINPDNYLRPGESLVLYVDVRNSP